MRQHANMLPHAVGIQGGACMWVGGSSSYSCSAHRLCVPPAGLQAMHRTCHWPQLLRQSAKRLHRAAAALDGITSFQQIPTAALPTQGLQSTPCKPGLDLALVQSLPPCKAE